MKTFTKSLGLVLLIIFISYLLLPGPDFPKPPTDSIQSNEPADVETPLRRAYFTNYTRAEVLAHYQAQFSRSPFYNLPFLTYRVNYPPEEAQALIRDQTRSTFLEEIVNPLRESLFVNGFEPKAANDVIFEGGRNWRQKVIVKLSPSLIFIRAGLGFLGAILALLLTVEWLKTFRNLLKKR